MEGKMCIRDRDYVAPVSRRIDEVLAATGAHQLVVVGHSMGGLVARAYLRTHGVAKVIRLITLGTPHSGSELAKYGIGENACQMWPGSMWLATLASEEPRVDTLNIYLSLIHICVETYRSRFRERRAGRRARRGEPGGASVSIQLKPEASWRVFPAHRPSCGSERSAAGDPFGGGRAGKRLRSCLRRFGRSFRRDPVRRLSRSRRTVTASPTVT